MKFFKWKIYIITTLVCLSPILFGLALWDKLPQQIAIHFDFQGNPDNFASRGFAVFGLPLIMVFTHTISCFANDFDSYKRETNTKLEMVVKWIIPCLTIALQIITLGIGLGWNIDVRKSACFLVGIMFIVLGSYIPNLDRLNGIKMEPEKAKKVNRFMGYGMVVLGILLIISIFLSPVYSTACLFLIFPYTIISLIYAMVIKKRP